MKFCETEDEYIQWARNLWREKQQQDSGELPGPIDMWEFMDYKEPVQVWADGECDYRRGFCHGIAYAVELIDYLRRKGYVRSSEISTIIDDFNLHQVYPWRYRAHRDIQSKKWREGHPIFKIEPWRDIRKKVFQRDGNACRYCGSTSDLECDHVESVSGGGMPTMDNLQTLCARCNLKKGAS